MRGKLTIICSDVNSSGITPADAGKTIRPCERQVAEQDHPRGCGENSLNGIFSATGLGSPPRMRGKHETELARHDRHGITPADAGKTLLSRIDFSRFRDHPRGCGENTNDETSISAHTGITPADAGKTSSAMIASTSAEDHPRGCGENRFPYRAHDAEYRITPADAGKTRQAQPPCLPLRDHPRGCGENGAVIPTTVADRRITPADAGKTKLYAVRLRLGWDHPRGCGENSNAFMKIALSPGSPPRMRGKPYVCACRGGGHRITPADAGKTLRWSFGSRPPQDHPRGCGENGVFLSSGVCVTGSPPRMRGKPACRLPSRQSSRITPADAGKTPNPLKKS